MRSPISAPRRHITVAMFWFLAVAAGTGLLGVAHACERNCRDALLHSIMDLFVPRIFRAYQTFERTLYMNLPRNVAVDLLPQVAPLVRTARKNVTSRRNVKENTSIRGVFLDEIPVVRVPGFRGGDCCLPTCLRDKCCHDRNWPETVNEFTEGRIVCGSEYSVAAHLDEVFYYVQTILQARSRFADANSPGVQELTAVVTRTLGPRSPWLVRYFGNLKAAVENLNMAYAYLKEGLERTYAPISMYLICIDHRLDRPQAHPRAHLENCTRPAFGKTPINEKRDGYRFPPLNYHLVNAEGDS